MCDSAKDPFLKEKSLIPTKLEDITTEWLNNTVFKEHKIHVESFKILGDAKGNRGYLSSLNRLQLKVQRAQLLLPDENENQTSEFEELNVIIKAIPSEPQLRSFIINAGYCQCELHMYREVLPKLVGFLDSRGVSKSNRFVHPICYYGAEEVGETHEDYKFILVLEDLVASKYQLWNGGEGAKKSFDWEHTAVALKQIALFHGSVVAFRKGRNDIKFLVEVFPKLAKPDKDDPTIVAYIKSGFAAAIEVIHDSPESIPQGLIEHLKYLEENFKEIVEEKVFTVNPDELNVIRHQDLHVNNVMFAHETTEDGLGRVPVQAKWFDFQGCQEGRPMVDVGFFLILNCLTAYSTTQLDRSLKVYHETFMGVLEEAGIQLPDYTFEQVKKDFRNYRLPSIIHIISGAPVWCCGPNSNQVSRDRLRNAIIYAYNSGELEWTKTSTLTTTS